MDRRFEIEGEITRHYRRFSATVTQLTVRFLPPPEDSDPMSPPPEDSDPMSPPPDPISHFLATVNELFE